MPNLEKIIAVKAILRPWRITGPIFDKEMRVASRRRRNYVLRFAYVALLAAFIGLMWLAIVSPTGPGVYVAGRMAEAGSVITASLVWFQFIGLQVLAVVLTSASISDEIYHRTLGVLMTTPILSVQIVLGKLFSKLLQLMLLLAIGLPLLAVIRVMGGVPMGFLVSSACITLTAVIFAASVTLLLSVYSRRSHVVILSAVTVLGVLYALVPLLVVMTNELDTRIISNRDLEQFFATVNPFAAMGDNTERMMTSMARTWSLSWPTHCLIMLGGSAAVLALAARVVRKVALRQANSEAGVLRSRRAARKAARTGASPGGEPLAGQIRRVRGAPVAWKELRAPLFRHRVRTVVLTAVGLGILALTYCLAAANDVLHDRETQMVYVILFVGAGLLSTAVLAATAVTSEKEARSWPILLATPLTNTAILSGKAVGVLRRCLPAWAPLGLHLLAFSLLGKVLPDLGPFIHPVAVPLLGMLALGTAVFLIGSGLYFSSRFRRTTTAVVMNLVLAAGLWAGLPGLGALALEAAHVGRWAEADFVLCSNPFVQAVVITEATSHTNWFFHGPNAANLPARELEFHWPDHGDSALHTVDATFSTMEMYTAMYCLLGLLFAWRAARNFRRNIF